MISFHKGLKVEQNYKAFRLGESEFYDLYRKLLDRPKTFGNSEDEQIGKYIEETAIIRRNIRNAEIDNLPNIEEIKSNISAEK